MEPEQERQPSPSSVSTRRVLGGAIWLVVNATAVLAVMNVLGPLNGDLDVWPSFFSLITCVGPIGLNLVLLVWLARVDRERFVGALLAIAGLLALAMLEAAACFLTL